MADEIKNTVETEEKETFGTKAKRFAKTYMVPGVCTIAGIVIGVAGALTGVKLAGEMRDAVSANEPAFGETEEAIES